MTTISKHFTKKAAVERAQETNLHNLSSAGRRSSGWKQFDYIVARAKGLRKWHVVTRHVR